MKAKIGWIHFIFYIIFHIENLRLFFFCVKFSFSHFPTTWVFSTLLTLREYMYLYIKCNVQSESMMCYLGFIFAKRKNWKLCVTFSVLQLYLYILPSAAYSHIICLICFTVLKKILFKHYIQQILSLIVDYTIIYLYHRDIIFSFV
jgi:hypothetical protein